MNIQWRLDSKAPGVADAFRKSTPDKRRRAALVACEMVIPMVCLEGAEVDAALMALREGRAGDVALQERLTALSGRLDDEYFRLDEEGGDTKLEALRHFSRARAASALAFALSEDSAQLHEAVYEALLAVFNDATGVERAAEAALR